MVSVPIWASVGYVLYILLPFLIPYQYIKLHEYGSEVNRMTKDGLYSAAEAYISSVCLHRASGMKAEIRDHADRPLLTIDDYEEVTDIFKGAKVWWLASKEFPKSNTILFSHDHEERRYYKLTFHKSHRKLIEIDYLRHILAEGRVIIEKNRQRRLFTNNPSSSESSRKIWSHVAFEHPATFNTLAMDPERKKEIMDDLVRFQVGKEYYKHVGKAWKRGYLLYGPPGTGKSTMIAAIANFLEYDVYDLELTAVKSNTELRKILLETTGKSIIVIEDIDCSLDLTGKRKEKKHNNKAKAQPYMPVEEKDEENKLTLSGLLNFVDGLWSSCGGERIIIFTTNHIEKLDPALIRKGRMDMRIEMSYCTFEAFKLLAKNYHGIENHCLFDPIRELLLEVKVSPADVAECLMLRSSGENDVDVHLQNLIEELKKSKEDAKKNAKDAGAQVEDELGEDNLLITAT